MRDMAITKQDTLNLLFEMKRSGIGCDKEINETIKTKEPSIKTIKFIYDNIGFDSANFYEKIRKSYNDGKSKLYVNIVKNEIEGKDVLTCLASLNLQILLYLKNVSNVNTFLRQMRFEEIQKVLLNYSRTGDIIPCQQLLNLFRSDLKVFEMFKKDIIISQEN